MGVILPVAGVEFKKAHKRITLYSDLNPYTSESQEQLEDLESIYASLNTILTTRPGERLFNLEFGIDLDSVIFDLMTDETELFLFTMIFQAIGRWETRITLDSGRSKIISDYINHLYDIYLVFSIVGMSDQNFEFSGTIRTIK